MKTIKLLLLSIILFIFASCNQATSCTKCIIINEDNMVLTSLIENQDSFILITGLSSCPACQKYNKVLNKNIDKVEVDIYYIEYNYFTDQYPEFYSSLANFYDGEFYVPASIIIIKGEVKYLESKSLSSQEFIDFVELYNLYLKESN